MRWKETESGGLRILADNQNRKALAEMFADKERPSYIDYDLLYTLFDSGNGGLHYGTADCFGYMSDAEMLVDELCYPENGGAPFPPDDTKQWFFPDSAIRCPWEQLKNKGYVEFNRV